MEQKIWIFALEEKLPSKEVESSLLESVNLFLKDWDAHGDKVNAKVTLIGKQVIAISLDSNSIIPSGCSKDKLDKNIREICQKLNLKLVDESKVVTKFNDSILILSRAELKNLLSSNDKDLISIVDYTLLGTDRLSDKQIFLPVNQTWATNLITK